MNLPDIAAESCPHCGAQPVADSNRSGTQRREFSCGLVLHFAPSWKDPGEVVLCPKRDLGSRSRAKRVKAALALSDFIDSLDVDENWKAIPESGLDLLWPGASA